jgi:zinc D-Ala-D-Ala carboxypeptidase
MRITILSVLTALFISCGEVSPTTAVASLPPSTPVFVDPEERDYLLGKFNPAERGDFVKVVAPYSDRPKMMLRKECYEAFQRMHAAAAKEGIKLVIISSTRTFAQQKAIWEGKWERFASDAPEPEARARKILEYSSMPGSSRHHWGTDIDLNDLNNAIFEAGGKYEKVYQWLSAHASEYGFCQPYTAGRPYGYKEEKWHWSYSPISKPLLETWKTSVEDSDIQGFTGSETARIIGIKEHYVLGIQEACK